MPKAYAFTEYGGPEMQTFVDLPRPVPGPLQLLVAVHAAAVAGLAADKSRVITAVDPTTAADLGGGHIQVTQSGEVLSPSPDWSNPARSTPTSQRSCPSLRQRRLLLRSKPAMLWERPS
jgi:hypothetical protein